jgi:hypothetical protein
MIKEPMSMFSEKCQLQDRDGIKELDRVGVYLVIANRQLYETGAARRYALVNEEKHFVHSVHDSQRAALVAQQGIQTPAVT